MKEKSEVFTLYVEFFHMVKIQVEKLTKHLRSDNEREYINNDMSKFLSKNGVFMNLLVWIHYNKMTLLKEKIGIFLR